MNVVRIEPEGSAGAVAWRRLREAPGLWLPLGLCAVAVGFQTAHWTREDVGPAGATGCSIWAAITALVVRAYHGLRFAGVPAAPDDDPHPLPVRWLDAPPGLGRPGALRHVHVLEALRIVGPSTSRHGLLALAAAAAFGGVAMGWVGPVAVLAVAWAIGFPRPVRIAAEVPWDAIAEVGREGRHRFRFRFREPDGGSDLVLEARFSTADVLADRLAQRIGRRLRPEGTGLAAEFLPSARQPSEGDDEAGVAELVARRLRGRWGLAASLASFGVALGSFAASQLAGVPGLRLAAGVACIVGAVLALASGGLRDSWRGTSPAPDDSAEPIPVLWRNRPGGPAHGPQQAHVLPQGLRLVGFEWETWDVLVLVGVGCAVLPVGGILAAAAVCGVLNAVGIPRRRRIAVEAFWQDVVAAEIRGGSFEIRTSLAAPADLLQVEAKYSARERLTAALIERLGDRATVMRAGGGAT